jgi:hypothetical protein
MNALATRQDSAPAATTPSRAAKVRDGLTRSEARFLAPMQSSWSREAFSALIRLVDYGTPSLRSAREALALDLSPELLRASQAELALALAGPADRGACMVLIGLMVAAYPSGRPADLDAYLETLVHDALAMGFTPYVVASACQTLRRTCRFLPSCAEFVEACGKAKDNIERSKRSTEFVLEKLDRARAVVEAAAETER